MKSSGRLLKRLAARVGQFLTGRQSRASRRKADDVLPPDYLKGKAAAPDRDGPARLLLDGKWCGHGEPRYGVFDIRWQGQDTFAIQLPESDDEELNPPVVLLTAAGKAPFPVYDSREHLCSIYADEAQRELEPRMQSSFHCPQCSERGFQVAVGFEVPEDSSGPNDTSWFALVAKCAHCGWTDFVYDDETA